MKQINHGTNSGYSRGCRCGACKDARREVSQQYYECNREQMAAKQRQYYERNREQILARNQRYRERNREQILAADRQYYERNREQILAADRQYYERNREQIAASKRRYRDSNREQILARDQRYRANKREHIQRKMKQKNDLSKTGASRHGTRWSAAEKEVLMSDCMSIQEIAFSLGRTISSVKHARRLVLKQSQTAA